MYICLTRTPSNHSWNRTLHRLKVVSLLNLSLSLLAHGLPQRVTGLCRLDVELHRAVLFTRKVDRLLREGDLGGQSLEVAFG